MNYGFAGVAYPELALKQNIVENNDDFWRKAYE